MARDLDDNGYAATPKVSATFFMSAIFNPNPSFTQAANASRCLDRRSIGLLFALAIGTLTACGASSVGDASGAASSCAETGCFNSDGGIDAAASDTAADIGNEDAADAGLPKNPLCGAGCFPDDTLACASSGAGGNGGVTDDGGLALPEEDAAADGAPYKGAKAGTPPFPPGPWGQQRACQVAPNPAGTPVAQCVLAGSGNAADPCVSASDCASGFACVGDQTTGICWPYCCGDPDACEAQSWCAERSSRDAAMGSPSVSMRLPVCVPGDNCNVLPEPGGTDGCSQGLACTIVRNDGTRACLEPGMQGEGEPCGAEAERCARGFVCSKSSMTCLKLCHIGSEDCGSGVCQAGTSDLGDSIGICVGGRL